MTISKCVTLCLCRQHIHSYQLKMAKLHQAIRFGMFYLYQCLTKVLALTKVDKIPILNLVHLGHNKS